MYHISSQCFSYFKIIILAHEIIDSLCHYHILVIIFCSFKKALSLCYFFFYVHGNFVSVYVCAPRPCSVCEGQTEALDLLEL